MRNSVRRKIRNEQIPLRQLERETGIHRQTLRKIRDNSQPPGYPCRPQLFFDKIQLFLPFNGI